MATKYVTLKDSNGDTIYPQSVIAQVANGEITTGLLADGAVTTAKITDGAVTSAKIDWSTILTTLQYKGQLTKSSNLDTLGDYLTSGTDGFYGFNMYTGSGGTGMPSENTNGILVVMSGPTYGVVAQFIIGGGVIYTRRYAGGTWGHWFKYAGTDIGA